MSFVVQTNTKSDLQYVLIDSGDGRKLESYNGYIMDRPDPQSLWSKKSKTTEWEKADAVFVEQPSGKREERGEWKIYNPLPENFSINFFGELKAQVKLNPFKHTGIFPEQYTNWQVINQVLKGSMREPHADTYVGEADKPAKKVLNLFGYTGCASLVAANAGAEVVHVDASKSSINTGVENAKLSNIADAPIRWILDDAFAFVKREIRRGNLYDGIIMDPPSFGRGAKGEVWKLEESFVAFVAECQKLLSPNALFFIVNGYSAGYSHIAYKQNLDSIVDKLGGKTESGEILIEDSNGRFLPCGIVARWIATKS